MHVSNLTGIIAIPQTGAAIYTMAGPAKTLAAILIAPGAGLSRRHRRLAEAHPLVSCSIRGDSETGRSAPAPDDFHQITLRWAIFGANRISIWSAPFPQCADDHARWGIGAANDGARFVTTIETTEERAAEWSALVDRWKRKTAIVRVFDSAIAGGVR